MRLQAHELVNEHDLCRDFMQNSFFAYKHMCFWAGKYGKLTNLTNFLESLKFERNWLSELL